MKSLFITLIVFFTLFGSPLLIERIFAGIVTSRGLAVSAALIFVFTCLHQYRELRREQAHRAEQRLRRRALFHQVAHAGADIQATRKDGAR